MTKSPAPTATDSQNAFANNQDGHCGVSTEKAVGEAGAMPGTDGFTMACFKAEDVPVGTKLYIAPVAATPVDAHEIWAMAQLAPGEGIVDGVMRIEQAMLGASPKGGSDAQDAERYRWLRDRMAVEDMPEEHPRWSTPSEEESRKVDAAIDAAMQATSAQAQAGDAEVQP